MRFILFCLAILAVNSLSAQIGVNTTNPNKFSELDIKNIVVGNDTIPKGIMIPRITTVQRDKMDILSDPTSGEGLLIYNIDEDCYNYYNRAANAWQSMCGTFADAQIGIGDCSTIRANGIYHAGVGLGTSNTISLPIKVTTPGNYNILAQNGNGYFFQASGVFPKTGSYTVKLTGIGTPTSAGTDNLVLSNNGTSLVNALNTTCSTSITVLSTLVTYEPSCEKRTVNGEYKVGQPVESTNTVIIPITPQIDGMASFATSSSNGVYFTVNQTVNSSTSEITLLARGIPEKAGKYNYSFTTNGGNSTACNFTLTVTSDYGSEQNPATSCSDILKDDYSKVDGEYFITWTNGTTTMTLCDMTNGGYTLIESFSERSLYGAGQSQGIYHTPIALQQPLTTNVPMGMSNAQNTTDPSVDYEMYRLPTVAMASAAGGNSENQYLVKIVEQYENIKTNNDTWANNNYFIYDFRGGTHDFLKAPWGNAIFDVKIIAKVFGKNLTVIPNSASQNRVTFDNGTPWNAPGLIGVWNTAAARVLSLSDGAAVPPSQPFSYQSSNGATITANFSQLNDLSYTYLAENQINHHFGKCGNASSDDYAGVANCSGAVTSRSPHRFNDRQGGYQGRYLLWFVK